MLFNSFTFWIFFAAVVIVYRFVEHRARNGWLLLASYFFYGYWDWRFLSLILFSTSVDFFVAQRIAQAGDKRQKQRFLLVSLIANLGLLAVFKYLGFFVEEFNALWQALGFGDPLLGIRLILPVGISFYTFQTLSYTIDVYRGETKATRNFWDFALYVSFFPQLVAGPIERSSHLLPQMQNVRPRCDEQRFREGLYHVLTGLFKKVIIADNMAMIANHVFNRPASELTAPEVLIGVYAFAFQIYGDFSGYSSIAQGLAKWLGFDLMFNFNHPYFAKSPKDFWGRWHISLSSWLRDYLYIPLGGNRGSRWMTQRNLMLTMLLGGLWHGAAWTFVVWGAIHGLWLVIHRIVEPGKGARDKRWVGVVKVFITFHVVCLTWLFFRAESLMQAIEMLSRLGSVWGATAFATGAGFLILFYVLPWTLFEYWMESRKDQLALTKVGWPIRSLVYAYLILMLLYFPPPIASEFIYFQF